MFYHFSGVRSPVIFLTISNPSPSDIQNQIDGYIDQILPIALIFVSISAAGLLLRKL